jgi:UDP-GlcNAc3NAcA epimerase
LYYQQASHQNSRIVSQLDLPHNNYILVTIHRAENTNDPGKLGEILSQLNKIGEEKVVVFPMHPRTKHMLGNDALLKNVRVIDPVGYLDMLALQKNSKLIVTDSGGVQKEAFLNGKYCITVREETEWVELVENGVNFLASPISLMSQYVEQLWNKAFQAGTFKPYGDGQAADEIVNVLVSKQNN